MITFGTGEAITGLRMIWTGIKWIVKSREAPWSALGLSATIEPRILPWHSVRISCLNERPYAIEVLNARSIRPKNILLCRFDAFAPSPIVAGSAATTLPLTWTIPEKGNRAIVFAATFLANPDGHKGVLQFDFELNVRLFDNKRTEMPVWVRTNSIELG